MACPTLLVDLALALAAAAAAAGTRTRRIRRRGILFEISMVNLVVVVVRVLIAHRQTIGSEINKKKRGEETRERAKAKVGKKEESPSHNTDMNYIHS